ncbi:MAG: LamG domain-containing protein [Candidatus Komeilibacteria bacterium]|nr:LamG domain-containing protein [Candidatus Komeilibacteria bacterium]
MAQEDLKSATVIADKTPNNYQGTITAGASAGFVADQRGTSARAYDFDGADTTIPTTLTSNAPFTSGFTISAWIKPDNTGEGNFGRIVEKATSGSNGLSYTMISNNSIGLNVNAGEAPTSANNSVPNGVWTHVLVTVASNAIVTHYINGVVSGTPGATSALSGITTANPLTIGNRSGLTDRTFNGAISDVRIYKRVLSISEITQLYGSYNPAVVIPDTEKGLVAHWSLAQEDLKSATVIADKTPNNYEGTISAGGGDGFVADQRGASARAYDFDGADTTIPTTLTSNAPFTSGFTISAWIKPVSVGENNFGRIVDKAGAGSADGFSYTFGTGGKLSLATGNGAGILNGSAISFNVWTHVLVTVASNATVTHYINGAVSGTPEASGALANNITPRPLTIGNRSDAVDRTFNGAISDVRIYNRVLSTTEITQLYGSYNPAVVISDTEKGLVGNWSLAQEDLKSATVIADKTPNNYQGTITAGASAGFVADQRGVSASAYDFSSSYVDFGTSLRNIFNSATKITLTAWIRADSFPAVGGRVFQQERLDIGDAGQFMVRTVNASGELVVNVSDGTNSEQASAGIISINTWYFVTAVYDGSTGLKIYLDGELKDTQTATNPATLGTSETNAKGRIGSTGKADGLRPWDGRISDVRIYNRSLSISEITQLYQSYK